MYASLSSALLGASILSLSTSAYLVLSGRITGLSGIFGGLLELKKDEFTWKATYAVGMSLTLLTLYELAPSLMISKSHNGQVISWLGAALGGIILGVGTTLNSGCTSGHGLCGLPRMSLRSWVSAPIFVGVATVTATLLDGNTMLRSSPGPCDEPHAILRLFSATGVVLLAGVGFRTYQRQGHSSVPMTIPLICSVIFAIGLAISGMTRTDVIMGFVSFQTIENWNITLPIVFGAAVFFNMITFNYIFGHFKTPIFPRATTIARAGNLKVKTTQSESSETNTAELKSGTSKTEQVENGLTSNVACYNLPTNTRVTPQLIAGSILFGVGMGMLGACPGPLISQVVVGFPKYWLAFVTYMLGTHLTKSAVF